MASFVALLRAINVGGTGTLSMGDLVHLCDEIGFKQTKTCIQSGNVVFKSALPESKVKAKLERALTAKMGKPIDAMVRTGAELEASLQRNPFTDALPNQVMLWFLPEALAEDALVGLKIPGREAMHVLGREVFVHYPDGMGRSKLKLPFAKTGTARNLNTVTKLAAMVRELEELTGQLGSGK